MCSSCKKKAFDINNKCPGCRRYIKIDIKPISDITINSESNIIYTKNICFTCKCISIPINTSNNSCNIVHFFNCVIDAFIILISISIYIFFFLV